MGVYKYYTYECETTSLLLKSDLLKELSERLERLDIKMDFTFDNTIEIKYPDNCVLGPYPGTFSIFQGDTVILTVSELFYSLDITVSPGTRYEKWFEFKFIGEDDLQME